MHLSQTQNTIQIISNSWISHLRKERNIHLHIFNFCCLQIDAMVKKVSDYFSRVTCEPYSCNCKENGNKNGVLTLLNAFTLSDDINLCCVLCAIGTNHPYAASFYSLRFAALFSTGSDAVSHFDHLV